MASNSSRFEVSGHRSVTGTVGTTGHAVDSALRECDESRGNGTTSVIPRMMHFHG